MPEMVVTMENNVPSTTLLNSLTDLGNPNHGRKERLPKRVLHFSDGTIEEYSSDEESQSDGENNAAHTFVDTSTMTWGPYLMHHVVRASSATLSACDFLGEHLANFLGITSPKYSYEIEEYFRNKRREEEEKEREEADIAGWQTGNGNIKEKSAAPITVDIVPKIQQPTTQPDPPKY